MTDLQNFLNTTAAEAPDTAEYPTGSKIRFQITRANPGVVGQDQKNRVVFRIKPVEVVSWPENAAAQPETLSMFENIDLNFMLTPPALANQSTHISAKRFVNGLGIDLNQPWTTIFEQAIGKNFVALIRRKPKYNEPEVEEARIAAVIFD